MDRLQSISKLLDKFNKDRDWDQFHDSKNLALGLFLEAAELNELYLWKKDSESEDINIDKLKEELADVFCYAIMLADKHNLNICDIIEAKIRKNSEKYPVEKARGTAKKYNEL
jgi:NTP pyrophosphatase (non-canonical NTP hydrolase)